MNKSHAEVAGQNGFRPGMRSLRSMKMHWTLTDFVELDSQVLALCMGGCVTTTRWVACPPLSGPLHRPPTPQTTQQFEYKIKAQKEPWCTKANMEAGCGQDFQAYMRRLNFEQCRMGYLYGAIDEKNEVRCGAVTQCGVMTVAFASLLGDGTGRLERIGPLFQFHRHTLPNSSHNLTTSTPHASQVRVEALYEPPQEGTHEGFELLEDPRAERVEELAAALQLKKVCCGLFVCVCVHLCACMCVCARVVRCVWL